MAHSYLGYVGLGGWGGRLAAVEPAFPQGKDGDYQPR